MYPIGTVERLPRGASSGTLFWAMFLMFFIIYLVSVLMVQVRVSGSYRQWWMRRGSCNLPVSLPLSSEDHDLVFSTYP